MNFFKCNVAIVLVAAVAVALAPGDSAGGKRPKPDFQIKFATLAPEGSTWMKTMRAIDDEVRRRTENRLGFKFYPGGVQGDEKEVLRKIRNGQLHGGGFTGFGLGSIVPEVRVQELPFMFESLDELDYLREQTNPYFFKAFEDKGYVHLGWADVGFVYVFSKHPIRTPEDMQNAKMWIWAGDPLAELFFKAFGLSPIPLAAPDVLTSLQTGVIDAVYGSSLACVALQWFTRINYMTDVPLTHGLGAALVSTKALRKVAPADLQILIEVSRPLLRQLSKNTRRQNVEAVEEMKKEGIEVVEVDDATRADFFRTGRSAWEDGVGELYSQALLDRVTTLLDDYRSAQADAGGK
ncbi:MAG: TRAP transporter substrate-binding protein DctP [Candidatus Latescibacterota bacterium]|jgi:TRAP-type C4-dicarboxylate transport system substrate-binding protein